MTLNLSEDKEIIDISPLVNHNSAVFPGDVTFRQTVSLNYTKGDNLKLSAFKSTCHIGAHADAPSHYHKKGKNIEQQDLSVYLGYCQVIDVSQVISRRITLADFNSNEIKAPRVLFKSNSIRSEEQWQDDFASLSPELLNFLGQIKVRLVGIDTPSVDPATDAKLLSHKACYQNKINILENLILSDVEPGVYKLIALPLRWEGLEASPVRAILLR